MGRTAMPHVEVRINAPVYDPERYNRGIAVLVHAYERALLRHLQASSAKQEEP
jgi:hypothetical protein